MKRLVMSLEELRAFLSLLKLSLRCAERPQKGFRARTCDYDPKGSEHVISIH